MLTVTVVSCNKLTDLPNLTKKPNEDAVSSESISDDSTSSDSSEITTESSTEITENATTTQKTTVTRKNATTSTFRSTNATSKATSSTKQTTKQTNSTTSTTSTTKKTTTTTTKKASKDEQYEWAKYWKGYAADYARSIGLNVLNEKGGAWDNPIRVNEAPGDADIASGIKSRLNWYKNNQGVTNVSFDLTHEYNNRWQLIVCYGFD